MKFKRKHVAAWIVALLFAVPVFAVFNEKDLGHTLSVLRYELSQELYKPSIRRRMLSSQDEAQHRQLVQIMKRCNELALMLYSQNQDYTFDMTYALKEVTKQYEDFSKSKMPYDQIIAHLDIEIERYSRLIESLRRLPPQLKEVENLPDSLAYRNDSILVDFLAPALGGHDHEHEHNHAHEADHDHELAHDHEHEHEHEIEEEHSERKGLIYKLAHGGKSANTHTVLDSLTEDGHLHTFFLDEQGQIDRDSCLYYATTLLKQFSDSRDHLVEDNAHYDEASARLKESYDYAQERYHLIQKRMFTKSQDNFFRIIKSFPRYAGRAFDDARIKYSRSFDGYGSVVHSEWRGPVVLGFMILVLFYIIIATIVSILVFKVLAKKVKFFQKEVVKQKLPVFTLLSGLVLFAISVSVAASTLDHHFFTVATQQILLLVWLFIAILTSLLIRHDNKDLKYALRQYLPIMVIGVIVITFRVIFIPNRLMNMLLPPVLLGITIWQGRICSRNASRDSNMGMLVAWICLAVLGVSTVMSWFGFVFLSIQVVIWWLFQVAAIETIRAINDLINLHGGKRVNEKIEQIKKSDKNAGGLHTGSGDYIRATWLYDFATMVVMPVLAVFSIPVTLRLALNVFDLTEICQTILYTTFFNFKDADGMEILKLSLHMILLAMSLYFVFRYVAYLAKSVYREVRIEHIRQTSGKKHIQTNEVNLTLANNLISILVWGTYLIMLILLLNIPMGAISIVAAGLATGIGLAMKDILNNFIYGIQLMSGRLRVGDWVECDGIRGKVTSISYQSTQIETIDGAVMSFLNTALFNKNFKNLTRNNAYEFVKILVGVNYGADVEKVRAVLLEALQNAQTDDKFGREVVDSKRGVTVSFDDFGDSSVNLAVKQYVLVAERNNYIAKAKEIIYDALNQNGIEIPFPQRDIHIRTS